MSARYSALPNPPRSRMVDNRELDEAFDSDSDEEHLEQVQDTRNTDTAFSAQRHDASAGNTSDNGASSSSSSFLVFNAPEYTVSSPADTTSPNTPAAVDPLTDNNIAVYDFERDYDHPPPGSPPPISTFAQPNDFGNTNGLLPSSAPSPPSPAGRQPWLRTVLHWFSPARRHYDRVPASLSASPVRGGGLENDGVFKNVQAKPSALRAVHTEDGHVIYMVPEETQKESPPSYADAQADAVPSYWETTVLAPASGLDPGSDMIVDDLPSGPVFVFVANFFTSFFIGFIGFLLTYILHTSHAAKYGSRAGLGLTLIQYGLYSRAASFPVASDSNGAGEGRPWNNPSSETPPPATSTVPDNTSQGGVSSRDGISFLLMTLGWFILFASFIGYWRIKHWESSIRASSVPPRPLTAEARERVNVSRRNIVHAFGIDVGDDEESNNAESATHEVAAFERNLRAAGFI
jgi:hypothetical protein